MREAGDGRTVRDGGVCLGSSHRPEIVEHEEPDPAGDAAHIAADEGRCNAGATCTSIIRHTRAHIDRGEGGEGSGSSLLSQRCGKSNGYYIAFHGVLLCWADANIHLPSRSGKPAALGDGARQLLHRGGMRVDTHHMERNSVRNWPGSADNHSAAKYSRLSGFDIDHTLIDRACADLRVGKINSATG